MANQTEQKITSLEVCTHHTGFELLSQRAKKVYLDRCLELIRAGKLVPVFLDQIVLYANAFDSYLLFDADVQENGPVLQSRDKRGDLRSYSNPAVKMRTDALRDVVRIGKNFSFTPLDRERIDDSGAATDTVLEWIQGDDALSPEELEKKREAARRKEEAAITRIYSKYGLTRDKTSRTKTGVQSAGEVSDVLAYGFRG